MKFNVVDLFAGIGGFTLGFHKEGSFQTVFANLRTADTGGVLYLNPSDGTHAQWQQGSGTGTLITDQLKTYSFTFFGNTIFLLTRCFYDFSFSGLPANSTITGLNFKIYGESSGILNDLGVPVFIKGNFDSSLANTDFNSFVGAGYSVVQCIKVTFFLR